MVRWIRWLIPIVVTACGVVVLFAGFVYDLVFAGIPYQDPPPELAARYAFHSHIASIIEWGGLLIVAIGAIGLFVVTVWTLVRFQFSKSRLRNGAVEGKPAGE
jgi:hypothetical protein